jgi:hypothetical protein
MRNSRLLALTVAAVVMAFAFTAASAAPPGYEDGAYTAATNTYYLNPDTGVTDDGGSKNAALGEGMCRSVVYKTALVEFDGDKIYATVRLQLMSNMKDFRLYVQEGAGGNYTKESPRSYSKVKPRTMSEDAGADTTDFRFEIPSVTAYMSWEMYVIPMGRDVKFYMNLSDELTPGGEDFIVSVKPKASPAPTAAPEPEPSSAPASPEPPPAAAESPEPPPSETSPPEPDAAPSGTPALAVTPAPEETMPEAGQEIPAVPETPGTAPEPSAAPDPATSPAPEETPEPAPESTPSAPAAPGAADEPVEDERQSGAGGVILAAAVIAVAAAAVIAVPRIVRRRK